jgi:hypothetical protein
MANRIPVAYIRGGTSKGLFFHERDLPPPGPERDALLLKAMGSPDPYGRQLDGMGGGVSSLSKVIVVRPSQRPEADVEFLHGQVSVDEAKVDYSANCGNLSAAVGPFAIDEGLLEPAADGAAVVRILNLNVGALIEAEVPVAGRRYDPHGEFAIPGVAGAGSRIGLQYASPGAGGTGTLFPTGAARDLLPTSAGPVAASLAYATLPVVWVRAQDLSVDPAIMPDALDANAAVMTRLEELRREGAVRMGLAESPEAAAQASPKIGLVGAPCDYRALDGTLIRAEAFDVMVRMVSMRRAHKASPLTGAMCLAATCLAEGAIAEGLSRPVSGPAVRLGTPSGVLTVGAVLERGGAAPQVERTIVYSTARRLMDGWVNVA